MMNVPMSETGTASSGISVARQPCRKRKTTRITSSRAMPQREYDFVDAGGNSFRGVERNVVAACPAESRGKLLADVW